MRTRVQVPSPPLSEAHCFGSGPFTLARYVLKCSRRVSYPVSSFLWWEGSVKAGPSQLHWRTMKLSEPLPSESEPTWVQTRSFPMPRNVVHHERHDPLQRTEVRDGPGMATVRSRSFDGCKNRVRGTSQTWQHRRNLLSVRVTARRLARLNNQNGAEAH